MNDHQSKLESDRQLLIRAQSRGMLAKLGAYARLSGPGWLQSAITLGGGSLASSLYLGVLAGVTMLWLQPLAMILGIVMLSAIAYVTMSTGERPFQAINRHVNPVLGWGWALASLAANMVWCLPQYSLATGVLQQNLFPDLLGKDGSLGDVESKIAITIALLIITTFITWAYGSGSWGLKLYEWILKLMVAGIVLCFFGVVFALRDQIEWGSLWAGFVPDITQLFRPSDGWTELLAAVPEGARQFWSDRIVAEQRNVMISAAATAVGINMTFLFPYSMLAKGWTKEFRGLAMFDLSTGMLIPFVLATTCVVVAAAWAFYPRPGVVELQEGESLAEEELASYTEARQAKGISGSLTSAEQKLALHLKRRDAFALARSLRPLAGGDADAEKQPWTDYVFGVGVLGMTLSTISLLMLISGFVICEILGLPPRGWPFRLGCLAAVTGALGPFVWSGAAFYLAVPTSIFGMTLLPIAYFAFFFLMNQKRLLGENMPSGGRRVAWNLAMLLAAGVATFASLASIYLKLGTYGLAIPAAFVVLALVAQVHVGSIERLERRVDDAERRIAELEGKSK